MDNNYEHIETLIKRYPALAVCKQDIVNAYVILEESYRKGNKLLVA